MGSACSSSSSSSHKSIPDSFHSFDEVQIALREQGLESCNLLVGIDLTKSNSWQGKNSFQGRCLHDIGDPTNPYLCVLRLIYRSLEPFDEDHQVPVFGFGEASSKNHGILKMSTLGYEEAIRAYTLVAKNIKTGNIVMSGPTSFAPIIYKALSIVQATGQYHILLIIADGVVDNETDVRATVEAIREASAYPLSIVVIGVGDGPWDLMRQFDDNLPQREFDNFQFVAYRPELSEANFAMHAMMEIPEQFAFLKKCGKIGRRQFTPKNYGVVECTLNVGQGLADDVKLHLQQSAWDGSQKPPAYGV